MPVEKFDFQSSCFRPVKGKPNIKPPDLWIHHDQMELKALEQKNGQSSSSSQDPLDQDSPPSSDPPQQSSRTNTSSIDKRTYVPSYLSQGECLAPFLLRPLAFSPVGAINLCFRPSCPCMSHHLHLLISFGRWRPHER
jgi:hypothetical protein